jgi:hypothetical protein
MIKLLYLAGLFALASSSSNTSCTTQKKPSVVLAEVHLITGEKLTGQVALSCLMGEGKVLAYKKCTDTECGSLVEVASRLSFKSDSKAPLEMAAIECPESFIQVRMGSRVKCTRPPKRSPGEDEDE